MTRQTGPMHSVCVSVQVRGIRWYHVIAARVIKLFRGPRRSLRYLTDKAEYRVNGGEWRRLDE